MSTFQPNILSLIGYKYISYILKLSMNTPHYTSSNITGLTIKNIPNLFSSCVERLMSTKAKHRVCNVVLILFLLHFNILNVMLVVITVSFLHFTLPINVFYHEKMKPKLSHERYLNPRPKQSVLCSFQRSYSIYNRCARPVKKFKVSFVNV